MGPQITEGVYGSNPSLAHTNQNKPGVSGVNPHNLQSQYGPGGTQLEIYRKWLE